MAKDNMVKARSGGGRRSAARLAAVQALYQFEDGDNDIEAVILEFLTHRPGALVDQDDDDQSYAETDRDMFADVTRGTARRLVEIDKSLARTLPTDWPVERIEKILRNVMRCGVYELQMRPDVPFRVIINEYVELARDFFGEDEPAMVNAVLDKIARQLREAEQSGK